MLNKTTVAPVKVATNKAKQPQSDLLKELYSIPRAVIEKSNCMIRIRTTVFDSLKKELKNDGLRVSDFVEAAANVYLREKRQK